jgi:hypothetical protein
MPRRALFHFTPPQLDVSGLDSPDQFLHTRNLVFAMLDLNDFITERGGDPKKIKESQRRRGAPEEVVDEVIALYEEARKGMP